jgi:hypothetical protein
VTPMQQTGRAVLAISMLLAASAAAQPPVFRTDVDLVGIDVLVTERGRPVAGLTADDFELRDNDVLQHVKADVLQDLPIDLVLVVDTSGSIGADASRLEAALRFVVGELRAPDRVAAVRFTSAVELVGALTHDHASISSALNIRPRPGSYTSAIDAVFAAMTLVDPVGPPTLVLVVSDGLDTSSWLEPDVLLAAAERSSATVSLVRPARGWSFPARSVFTRLCAGTGGEVFDAGQSDRVDRALSGALARFRTRYRLRFTPSVAAAGWHRVEIRIKKRPHAAVHARPGYYRDRGAQESTERGW